MQSLTQQTDKILAIWDEHLEVAKSLRRWPRRYPTLST